MQDAFIHPRASLIPVFFQVPRSVSKCTSKRAIGYIFDLSGSNSTTDPSQARH